MTVNANKIKYTTPPIKSMAPTVTTVTTKSTRLVFITNTDNGFCIDHQMRSPKVKIKTLMKFIVRLRINPKLLKV